MKQAAKSMAWFLVLLMVMSMVVILPVSVSATALQGIETTDEEVYAGRFSLKVAAGQLIGTQAEIGVERGGTYSVEFYLRPLSSGVVWFSLDGGTRSYLVYNAEQDTLIDTTNKLNCVKADKEGWWRLYGSGLVAVSHATNTGWIPEVFVFESGFSGYIDSIKVTNETNQKSVYYDFELTPEAGDNIMALQVSGTQISVSWKNNENFSEIILYNENTNEMLSRDFNLSKGRFNEYLDTANVGNYHSYRLEFTYTDGFVKSYTLGCYAKASGYSYQAGGWTATSSSLPKPPAKMEVDDSEYHTAAPSIHVVSNQESFNTTTLMLQVKADTPLDTAKTYRVTGYTKVNTARYIWGRLLGTNDSSCRAFPTPNYNALNTTVWNEFSVDGKPVSTDPAVINFCAVGEIADFWIDDVALYELDADGEPATGINLLGEKGEITSVEARPDNPTGILTTSEADRITVTWDSTDADFVAIYDSEDVQKCPVAYVPASLGEVTLYSLESGVEYNYLVKTVNEEGRESQGVRISASTLQKPLVIGDYTKTITENTIEIGVKIKNNDYGADLTVKLMLGLYNQYGGLVQIAATDVTEIPESVQSAAPISLKQGIEVPEGCSMKAFLWDMRDGIKPLTMAQEYKSPAATKEYLLTDSEKVRLLGRGEVLEGNSRTFNWPNSGFEFTYTGSVAEVYVDQVLAEKNEYNIPYFNVSVDGAEPVRKPMQEGWNILYTGKDEETHTIRVVRSSEACKGTIRMSSLRTDGLPTATEARDHQILFIGDSYTAGYGNSPGLSTYTAYCAQNTDNWNSYTGFLERHYQADATVLAYQGKGACFNRDGLTTGALSEQFEYADILVDGSYNMSTKAAWGFEEQEPQIVSVFLGTNDRAGVSSASFDDPEAYFEENYQAFLERIRFEYPNATILCLSRADYGMMTQISNAVTALGGEAKGIYYMEFSPFPTSSYGHPNIEEHQALADKLIEKIDAIPNIWE